MTKGITLLAVEIAFFILFVAFMLTNETLSIVGFILLFIFLGIFLKKWTWANQALTHLFKELETLSMVVFILLLLSVPLAFQRSP
jgi:hypothetical protein